ncbi:MAG: Ig-like domain-containing protein [Gemmatimonadaceae bacterium]
MQRGSNGVPGLTTLGLGLAMASVIAVGACGSDSNVTPPVATNISSVGSTNNQTGVVGAPLAQPVGVIVTDQNAQPLANATVTWTVIGSGGSVASPSSTTDATGSATVVWTLGPVVGADSLTAAIGTGASTSIVAMGTVGAVSAVQISSGNGQSVAAGSTTAPLVVKVIDQFANPIVGATVSWAVSGGGSLSATSSVTDATGSASVTLTTDPTAATYMVNATTGSIAPVTFTITAM